VTITYPLIDLKMAVSRFQISANKKSALTKQQMREIAVMLSEDPPKEEKAKIRAEALIREDNAIEAYEILQLECELLAERIKLIDSSKECPPDLVSCVSTVIWASDRVDFSELSMIRKQFRAKYGKQFEEAALTNLGGRLNERVISKLSVQPPAAHLVQVYLERICEKFEVDWEPKVKLTADQMSEPMVAPVGYSVNVASGTGLGELPVAEATTANPPPPLNNMTIPSYDAGPANVPDVRFAPPPHAPYSSCDYDEVDIYVPGMPIAPAGSGSKTQDEKNDEDDMPGPRGGVDSTSLSSLQAKFDALRK
jgi:hypothetical protein